MSTQYEHLTEGVLINLCPVRQAALHCLTVPNILTSNAWVAQVRQFELPPLAQVAQSGSHILHSVPSRYFPAGQEVGAATVVLSTQTPRLLGIWVVRIQAVQLVAVIVQLEHSPSQFIH
jgi:hypothetical protein